MSVIKICEICGKEFQVIPCRAKTARFCSKTCANIGRKAKDNVTCTNCGKSFHKKQSALEKYSRNMGIFCSLECSAEYRKKWFKGKNNHQFGLKGELNSSFKRGFTTRRNGHVTETFIYAKDRSDTDRSGRMTLHRYNVVTNFNNYHTCLFTQVNDYFILKPNLHVYHIDGDHNNNELENLTVLSQPIHTKVHNQIKELSVDFASKIIGVFKKGELLENPEVGNQQPSLSSNTFEGSETNSRIRTGNAEDSNVDTSALLSQIQKLTNDYIVQTKKITEDGHQETIKQILESEIKSSE